MSADVPMLEPTNMQEAKDMIPYAFELSERTQQMVLVRLTTVSVMGVECGFRRTAGETASDAAGWRVGQIDLRQLSP